MRPAAGGSPELQRAQAAEIRAAREQLAALRADLAAGAVQANQPEDLFILGIPVSEYGAGAQARHREMPGSGGHVDRRQPHRRRRRSMIRGTL